MSFFRVSEQCNGCLACVQNCPATALDYRDEGARRTLLHNMALCARCGNCWRICPQKAIEFRGLLQGAWEEVATMSLVHCRICGDPLYTSEFGEDLEEKLDREIEPLCPQHRKIHPMLVWQKLSPEASLAAETES